MNQPAQQQEPPGVQSAMTPRPDCGEESYVGAGRLTGNVAVITGGDSGIGRAWPSRTPGRERMSSSPA